jgi:hypothetical protein
MNNILNDLDELVRIEDGLHSLKMNWSLDIHLSCYSLEYQKVNQIGYEQAVEFVKQFGTIRKAQNEVARCLKLGLYMQS